MPISTRLIYLSLTALLILTTVFIYSCKDDSSVVVDDGDGDGGGTQQEVITVSSPRSGDTLTASGLFNIIWTSNSASEVRIEFSDDNGATWVVIEDSTENIGVYTWAPIPDSISSLCKIKVSSVEDGSISSTSGAFKIVRTGVVSLSLTKPNGGEILFSGDNYTIAWKSTSISQVKLEFSSDAGASWNIISPNYPADSLYYIWSPIPNLKSKNCLVKISDVLTGSLIDSSNSVFTIGLPMVVRVISPNGGEDWPAKSNKTITWYSSEVSSVKIEYSSNNGIDWFSVVENTESDGYFIWDPLPDLPSTNSKIRITNIEDGFPSDASDSVFTVSPEDALTLIAPNGGEQWQSGSSQYIRWNSLKSNKNVKGIKNKTAKLETTSKVTRQVGSVKLEYTTNSGASWSSIAQDVPNNGSYVWASVPSASSSLCKVRISDMEDSTPFDISDSTFTIYNSVQQDITVTSPVGGEIWNAGTSQAITWTSSGVAAVKIEYTINNGIEWVSIIDNTPSDGFYNWGHVPNVTSTNCKIRISDADDGFPADVSSTFFSIAPEPEITVLTPNGGESIKVGSNINIKWTSTNIPDVKIEFTTNNGATWTTIIESTPSDGLYEWTDIPIEINSSLCRIKINDANDGVPFDVSDNNFSIDNKIERSITVTSPNGGETIVGGTHVDISWTSLNLETVTIDFSTNNGANWIQIVTSLINTGTFEWGVPDSMSSNQCRIRVSDISGLPYDISNSPFTITPIPSLTVIYPNGGEGIVAGTPFVIKWDAVGVAYVKIDYTGDNGINYFPIIVRTPNNGKYTISLTSPGTFYKIRIGNADEVSPIDESDGTFRIIPEPSITVISPDGNEIWPSGTSQNITWTSTGIQNVSLEFTTNNGASWNSIISSTESDGLYPWVVPSAASSLCKIRIKGVEDTARVDVSDGTFTISQEPLGITITSPNGGEVWESGTSRIISWVSNGISDVKIEYTINNGVDWSVITLSTRSDGFYQWSPLPNTPSTDCRIRISDIVDNYTDQSDDLFSIAPEPTVQVTVPDGGEMWPTGSSQNILWTSINISKVKIELSSNGGAEWSTIIDSTESDGVFTWSPLPNINSLQCRIRISDIKDGLPYDTSAGNFIIGFNQESLPSITVTSPNGGENWEGGTSQSITWTSDNISNVKIEFTSNNGVNWSTIVANTPSDGFYQWSAVPNTPSTNCKIRISDVVFNFTDESNNVFSVNPESQINVVSPNGGETFRFGSTANINWTSANIENIKIEFTTDGGATWSLIAASVVSNGLYVWSSIPNISSAQCRIRISDASDGVPFDISDNNFSVTNEELESITIISPNGGGMIEAGTSQNITWTSSAINNVNIDFSANNGDSWSPIATAITNSGSYEWNVPNINSTQCKIRVSDTDGSPSDESNSAFTIQPIQNIRVIYPNGGETILSGSAVSITWESVGIQKVRIEYSLNNGSFGTDWHVLVDSIPAATGSYSASFALAGTTINRDFRVRISDALDGSPVDYSDGTFTVLPPPSITVTSPNGGENWLTGNTYEITWVSTNIDSIRLEYTLNGGADWIYISDAVSNGLYNWSVPPTINFRSDICKVRITYLNNGITSTYTDMSDGFFSLHPQTKLLRLLFPNGGEFIYQDTLITWTSAGISAINIELSVNNGLTWSTVANNVPSTGAYLWNSLPAVYSTTARIKITDANNPAFSDESDSYFNLNIIQGLMFFNPGDGFNPGKVNKINWRGPDDLKEVSIEYSVDEGISWQLIASNVVHKSRAVNEYLWKPAGNEVSGNVLVRVSDPAGKYKSVSKNIRVVQ